MREKFGTISVCWGYRLPQNGKKKVNDSLVPLVDGVVVDQCRLDLDGAQEGMLLERAVIHAESDDRLLGGHIAVLDEQPEVVDGRS